MLGMAGLIGMPAAHAAHPADVADVVDGAPPAVAAAPAAVEVLTRAGDTLERLARRHHPGSVLTPAALAQAWWRVNAAAFPAGPPRRLPAGLRLRRPTERELVRLYFPAALAQAAAGEAAGPAGGSADATPAATVGTGISGTTRPRWVRFP
jgi:Tfp pilus assembly protein FimV